MPTSRSSRAAFAWLVFGHAAVDAYALVVPFLTPILLRRLVPTEQHALYAGAFAAMVAMSTSLGQMGVGLVSDRGGGSVFLWGGLAAAALGMGSLGLAPSMSAAFVLMAIGGIGVAAFHPPAAAAAGRLSQQARGSGISLFMTGGNLGQAVGPFLLIVALSTWGASAFAWSVVPGLVLAAALTRYAPRTRAAHDGRGSVSMRGLPIPYGSLAALCLIVMVRTVTINGFIYFLAVYLTQDLGLADIPRAGIQAGFIFLGSMGIMLGGRLSDRMPRMPLLIGSLILPVPLLIAALQLGTAPFIVLLLAGNFFLQSSSPIYVVLAQEAMPGRENIASSITMGVAWGLAGIVSLPIGAIAGHFGLVPVLTALGALPLAGLPLLFLIVSRHAVAPEAAAS